MKQLLPFRVGYETYALELIEIQEIVEQQKIHAFPGAPDVVAGAIGFHGRIVPVIDLAKLLDFPTGKIGQRLIVLIDKRGPVALGVDRVGSIINLEITQANRMQNYSERAYISDIFNWGGGMISLLDLDQVQAELELRCDNSGG